MEKERIVAVVSLAECFSLAVVEIVTEEIVAESSAEEAEGGEEPSTGGGHLSRLRVSPAERGAEYKGGGKDSGKCLFHNSD